MSKASPVLWASLAGRPRPKIALMLARRGATALPVIADYLVPNAVVVLFKTLLTGSRAFWSR